MPIYATQFITAAQVHMESIQIMVLRHLTWLKVHPINQLN